MKIEEVLEVLNNPRIFEINTIPMFSDHDFSESNLENRISLNGTWNFKYLSQNDLLTFDKNDLSTINVPSNIELEGYGIPEYSNMAYDFDGIVDISSPNIPNKLQKIGYYKREFCLDDNFSKKHVILRFNGVRTCYALYLNDKFIGYKEGSFTPGNFDITDYLLDVNKLEVYVFKYSTGSHFEDQDFWFMTGIFRNVELLGYGDNHIKDISVVCDYDSNFGDLKVNLDILGNYDNLSLKLYDSNNSLIFSQSFESNIINIKKLQVKPWSAEFPNLYKLEISINVLGIIVETSTLNIGFRTFTIDNGLMKINGKRIVFNGVNRHELNNTTGFSVSKDSMLEDILIMKQNNINALRMSHYPNSSYMYELCDKYGIYVIDEVNIETHGTWQKAFDVNFDENTIPNDDEEYLDLVLARGKNMYERDKNHASILIWSLGNEAGGGSVLNELSNYFKKVDKSRLVQYEGLIRDRRYNNSSDIESQMYPTTKQIIDFLDKDDTKPFICCEYMHAMGNSCGGFSEYTNLSKTNDKYQGGFIWDFLDQGLLINGDYIYGGDLGERPTDYNFCCNGLLSSGKVLTTKMLETKYNYSGIELDIDSKEITIRNYYLFTNLNQFDIEISMNKEDVIISKSFSNYNLEPGKTLKIKSPICRDSEDELFIKVRVLLSNDTNYAKKGHEIVSKTFSLNSYKLDKLEEEPLNIISGGFYVGASNSKFSVLFSKVYASIVSYKYLGKEFLEGFTYPIFSRATTDNDRGSFYKFSHNPWYSASDSRKLVDFSSKTIGETLEVRFTYAFPSIANYTTSIVYTVNKNGRINVEMTSPPLDDFIDYPLYGLTLTLNKNMENVRYYGNGPVDNYIDKSLFTDLGIYSYNVNNYECPYIKPQEYGNITSARYIEISDTKYKIKFESSNKLNVSYIPYNMNELENANHNYELKSNYNYIRIASEVSGLGGIDSWMSECLDKFKIPSNKSKSLKFSFYVSKLEERNN